MKKIIKVTPGRHISVRLDDPKDRVLFYKLCALREKNMSEVLKTFVLQFIEKNKNLLK